MSGAPEGSTGSGSGLNYPRDGNTALRLIDYWDIASKQLLSPIYKKYTCFVLKSRILDAWGKALDSIVFSSYISILFSVLTAMFDCRTRQSAFALDLLIGSSSASDKR